MGKSNRTAALESKIELLLGEEEILKEEIAEAEEIIEQLPEKRARLRQVLKAVRACETVIKIDYPDWTREHLSPSRPFVHKLPVRFGNASKFGLDVLRVTGKRMYLEQIADEVLRREGIEDAPPATVKKVAASIGNSFRKKKDLGYVDTDGMRPALWWAISPK